MIPLCHQGIQGINIVENHSVILILTKIARIGRVGKSNMGELGHYGRVWSWTWKMGHCPTLPHRESWATMWES